MNAVYKWIYRIVIVFVMPDKYAMKNTLNRFWNLLLFIFKL